MGAFAQASVDTVECTLDWDIDGALVDLAISSRILRVAHTSSIVAPSSISTVVGACLETAVNSSEAWLAPACSIQANTVVSAVVDANGD
jgi:hypothetical protein